MAIKRIALSLLLLLLPVAMFAQASGAALSGRITDDQGSAIPGVTVTAVNDATGLQRVIVTDSTGAYRFALLPVGTYTVTTELEGFGKVTTRNVDINVATERGLDVTLRPAAVQESITVTAEAPLISTSPSVGTTVSQTELENLPLNGRQFANLATLAPGTSLSVNTDPTKPGQLTIALNGGSGRNVNFIIDGGDNTDDTIGGALQNFNLEAVQEFTIQTMQYKAEFGRSSGGVLSVVTKTGTNDFGGSVYGFFRDDSLNETTRTEKGAGLDAQPYERQQWGASIGGPIVRDRAHFFATYEKTTRDTNYTVDTGGIFPDFDGRSFATPFEDELITAKATLDLSARQLLQVRYGYQKNTDKYGANPLYLPSSLGTVSNKYESVLGGHTAQVGSDSLNEFVIQWTRFDNAISADSEEPNFYFPSGVSRGQNFNTPQTTNQEKAQFKDDFSWASILGGRRHDFKTGVNYIHEPILGGTFTTGTSGQYQMLEDRADSPVQAIDIRGGFFGDRTPVDQYNIYVQDDWSLTDRLTLNLGLRYDFWTGFDLDQRSSPLWQAFSQSTLDLEWLTEFRNGGSDVLENDDNNWGPRLGFTWDMNGTGRNLIRGGWGIYYDFPYTNATILFPAAAVQSDYGSIYSYVDTTGIKNPDGSFFRPGLDPLPPNQLGNPDVPAPTNVASSTLATPMSTQASLGYSWQVNPNLGLTFDAVSVQYRDIPYRFRANPLVDTNGDGTRDARAFPAFSTNTRLWTGEGEADYNGFNVGIRARLASRFEMQGFYTISKAEGNVLVGADEFRFWDNLFQPGPLANASINAYDPQCDACFGPLYTDARHRVTLSGVYRAPFAINLSGILRYRSAFPYTDLAGTDVNGDGYNTDLPAGVESVQTLRGDSFMQLDVRVAKEFGFGNGLGLELMGEIFNLTNEDNPAAPNGTRTAQNYRQPTRFAGDPQQGEQRLAQLGLRLRF